ncbi:MAG: LytTR family DNA-binding domain-containing protein [Oscillospiraceae bacterium]|jgi:DNA-binding LytR/AlgR family response regulator|nr:LytTR family DNA-binding domain-containing protein [Oscillospiraceae bacterium]
MVRIAICDDEQIFSSQIETLIVKLAKKLYYKIDTEVFNSGAELRSYIESGETFDVIYMDIEMPDMNGVEAGKWLRKVNNDEMTLLIYVSSHEGYYSKLFDVQPYNFIKKPIDKAEFERIFAEVCNKIVKSNALFEFSENRIAMKLRLSEVMYFESEGRYVNIHATEKVYKTLMKLDDITEKVTDRNFVRIHKSLFVNIDFIRIMTPTNIKMMKSEVELRISEQYQQSVKSQYMAYLKGDKF